MMSFPRRTSNGSLHVRQRIPVLGHGHPARGVRRDLTEFLLYPIQICHAVRASVVCDFACARVVLTGALAFRSIENASVLLHSMVTLTTHTDGRTDLALRA
jgi:hypothetical protein